MTDDTPYSAPEAVELEPIGPTTAAKAQSRTAIIAGLAAFAIAAAAIGITATSGPSEPAPVPLSLRAPGTAETAGAGDADRMMLPMSEFRYVLAGALPDLGTEAKVYRLTARSMSADDVARMGEALGIESEIVDLDGYGWEMSTDARTLTVSGDGTGWYLSMWNGPSGRVSDGSTGREGDVDSGDGGSSGASAGGGTEPVEPANPSAEAPPDEPIVIDDGAVCTQPEAKDTPVASDDDPSDSVEPGPDDACLIDPVPVPMPEPEPMPAPKNLPDANTAERIARDTLNALGVLAGGDWQFEQFDGAVQVTSCAADGRCDEPGEPVLYSRTVIAHRVIDGRPVMGLDWYVDIGDNGVVQSLSGVIADVAVVADYPLRPTADVFADLQSGKSWYGGGVVALADDTLGGAPDIAIAPECIDTDCEVPEPEIVDVTVTDVALGLQLWYGVDADNNPVQYVVPSYHFTGSFDDGTEWSTDLLAVSDEYINPTPTGSGEEPPLGAPEPAIIESEVDPATR
jgi:hypothetical protein